jgi:hypothetical protein
MAYNEILMLFLLATACFMVGIYVGQTQGKKEVSVTDYQDGYKEGFETAKKMFYEDPKKERELEKQAELEKIKELNTFQPKVTPELLMAYGVANTAHLPKDVREYYKLNGKPAVDLESLIEEDNAFDRD